MSRKQGFDDSSCRTYALHEFVTSLEVLPWITGSTNIGSFDMTRVSQTVRSSIVSLTIYNGNSIIHTILHRDNATFSLHADETFASHLAGVLRFLLMGMKIGGVDAIPRGATRCTIKTRSRLLMLSLSRFNACMEASPNG